MTVRQDGGRGDIYMDNGRKNRGWIVALAGGILAVLMFLAIVLVGVGIYNAPKNRLKRLLDLGDKYLTAQEYEQAAAVFTQAIEIDPKGSDAYLGLADAYEGIGDTQAAYEILESGYQQTGDAGMAAGMRRIEETSAIEGQNSAGSGGSGAGGGAGENPEHGGQAGEDSEHGGQAGGHPADAEDAGPAEGELVLDFRWDGLSLGGTLANLTLALTIDGGGTIYAEASDGGSSQAQLLAQDGTPVLEIETADLGTEKSIRVTVRRTDGTYHLTLEDDESMELYGDQAGIGRSEVRIYLITSEGETELDREDYLYRYPTGYWMLEMDIDHGTVG